MGIARQSPPSQELKIFSERLRDAIKFKKIDISVLAKETEYKPDDIHKLLTGMREPGFKKIMLLANSLGCSVDYLLGLTPKPQRASIVIEADTNALNRQSSERGQTSGQIPGIAGQFAAMVPELLESDVEILMCLARFLIERKGKRLAKLIDAVNAKPPKETGAITQVPHNNDDPVDGFDEEDIEFDDDEFDDDDFEDEDFGDEDFEDEDEDFEDEDDFNDD